MVRKDGGKGLAKPIQNPREGCYNTIIPCLPRRLPTPGLAAKQRSCFPYRGNPYVGPDRWNQNPKSQKEFSQSLFYNSCELTDKSLESTQRLHEAS